MDEPKGKNLFCPRCGKRLPIQVMSLEGKMEVKVYCKRCHGESVIELKG